MKRTVESQKERRELYAGAPRQNNSCRQRESSERLQALILLDKTGMAAMTFNQVVRGSSPRCLMNEGRNLY